MARAHADDTPPVDQNLDNGAAITTACSFVVASNRTIYAWWFWPPTTNSGTYTLELWEITGDDDPGPAAGTLLASKAVAAAAVTPGEWNRVALDTPVAVVTTEVYRAARHTSSGRFVRTAQAFNGASISNSGITLIESGTNPGGLFPGVLRNGTFREGSAGNYPASSFDRSDYYIDVDDADDAPDPIDVAGAITVGEPSVSAAAVVKPPVSALVAIAVGEPSVSGSVSLDTGDVGTPASSTSTVTVLVTSTATVAALAGSTSTTGEG